MDVKTCLKNHIGQNLPAGDWTIRDVGQIIAQFQGREQELEACIKINDKFYQELRIGLGKQGKKGWFR